MLAFVAASVSPIDFLQKTRSFQHVFCKKSMFCSAMEREDR